MVGGSGNNPCWISGGLSAVLFSGFKNREIDCLFPVNLSVYDGEEMNVSVTSPFVETEVYAVVRKNVSAGKIVEHKMTVAMERGDFNYEKVHLPDMIHELQAIIQSNVVSRQLEFCVDTQNVLHEDIITDNLRLNQVLLNILSNAIKYTPPGGKISFRVIEKTSPVADFANFEFIVKDNGIGMGEEFQKTIFDAFTRENPSDADFSPSAVDSSLEGARRFFAEYYPVLTNAEYRCHSWLLDQQLKKMLNENSNILHFQNRFEIFDEGEINTEFIEWLYHTKSTDYDTLPENTSLQRKMKKHLLLGGVIRNAYGRLKQ